MANEITVTKADVRPLTGAIIRRYTAGGTMYVGDVVYVASDGDVEAADGSAVATLLGFAGIVVSGPNGATTISAGDAIDVVTFGPVAGYLSMTPGALIYVSDTVGRLSTVAGTKSLIVGYSESAAIAFVNSQYVDLT
jgi:hypothetical protein